LLSRLLCEVQGKGDAVMENDYLRRVNAYLQAVAAAENLRRDGVISDEDFARIEPLFLAKYGLFIRSIYR